MLDRYVRSAQHGKCHRIGKPLRYSNIVYDVVMERSWIFQSIRIKLNREH